MLVVKTLFIFSDTETVLNGIYCRPIYIELFAALVVKQTIHHTTEEPELTLTPNSSCHSWSLNVQIQLRNSALRICV